MVKAKIVVLLVERIVFFHLRYDFVPGRFVVEFEMFHDHVFEFSLELDAVPIRAFRKRHDVVEREEVDFRSVESHVLFFFQGFHHRIVGRIFVELEYERPGFARIVHRRDDIRLEVLLTELFHFVAHVC